MIYTTVSKEEGFYYIDLQSTITNNNEIQNKLSSQKTVTIHIPITNCALEEDIAHLLNIIESYYD